MPRTLPPLTFERNDRGCLIITSHKPNPNGYIYVAGAYYGKEGRVRAHRAAYEKEHGEGSIPEGYEIDHLCGNRACVEPRHLRALPKRQHAQVTSAYRYEEQNEERRLQWLAYGRVQTGNEIAKLYGVDPKTGKAWVERWATEYEENERRREELAAGKY